MDQMKAMRDAMKSLAAMANGKAAFDRAAVGVAANAIREKSGAAMMQLFPEGSTQHPSEALPKIWTDWPGFEFGAKTLEMRTGQLTAAEEPAALKKALGEVAGVCKDCHNRFRSR
jgi:cytochrome c556